MSPSLFYLLALSVFSQPTTGDGSIQLPTKEAQQAADEGNLGEALELLKRSASEGNAPAAFGVGDCYLLGKGTQASLPEAVKWYKQAATAGHATAMLRLGRIYHQGGEGLKPDEALSRFYLQGAAEAGVPNGWSMLGQLSELAARKADKEPERQKFFREARSYYEKGAKGGDPEGQLLYAQILTNPGSGDVDLVESVAWLRKSAHSGNPTAMNELGMRIQEGKGAEADQVAALGWYLAAAERNLPAGMTNLGLCYANGFGVPIDFNKAGIWYDRAAKQNYAPAQFLIGQLFENGQGTKPKPVFAYVHYYRAARSGHHLAIQARDTLKEKLTAKQLLEAEDLIAKPAGK